MTGSGPGTVGVTFAKGVFDAVAELTTGGNSDQTDQDEAEALKRRITKAVSRAGQRLLTGSLGVTVSKRAMMTKSRAEPVWFVTEARRPEAPAQSSSGFAALTRETSPSDLIERP